MGQPLDRRVWFATIGTSLLVDQLTKSLSRYYLMVRENLDDTKIYQGSRILVFDFGDVFTRDSWAAFLLQLNYVRNHGAAFGVLRQIPDAWRLTIFNAVSVLTIIAFGFISLRPSADLHRTARFAFCLMISGALGNLVDRNYFGYVVDWIDFRWRIGGYYYAFPVFNVADVAVVLGLVLLGTSLVRKV